MNNINSISPDIRDFLLSKNLAFADSISNNGYEPYSIGIGLPVQFNNAINVNPSDDIEDIGILYKDLNIINNKFLPNNPEVLFGLGVVNQTVGNLGEYPDFIGSNSSNSTFSTTTQNSLLQLNNNRYLPNAIQSYRVDVQHNNIFFDQIIGGYTNSKGKINGLGNVNAIDSISGLLTGASTFDIRSSLASRVLSGVGSVNDTELGLIGNRELLKAMKAKAAFNARRELLGKVNLNPISLIKGDDFIKEDYSITVPSSKFGRVLDVGLNILGFESPISYVDQKASIFDYELYSQDGVNESFKDTFLRNQARIENTSKGQLTLMFKNLEANLDPKFTGGGTRYTPGYGDTRVKNSGKDFNLYTVHDSSGKNLENFDGDVNYIGTYSKNISSDAPFSWNTRTNSINTAKDLKDGDIFDIDTNLGDFDNVNTRKGGKGVIGTNYSFPNSEHIFNDKKTLLGKTQELFDKGIIRTLLGNKGMIVDGNSLLESPEMTRGSLPMLSKGSAVKYFDISNGGNSENPNNVFCRSWLNYRGYSRVGNLQKHRGLDPNGGVRNQGYKSSVLDSNGFVKFAPYKSDFEGPTIDVKKYMFSLENLAWSGKESLSNLPEWEIGNGDKITGTKGRIMWFPPYDLSFSESTSVGIDSTNFIGRGEPVYTYNNTERTGSLSFKVIMDHPNYLNDASFQETYKDYFDDVVNSITAGCGDIPASTSAFLTQNEKDAVELETAMKQEVIPIDKQKLDLEFKIYFANDVSKIDGVYSDYELLGSTDKGVLTTWKKLPTGGYTPGITTTNNGTYEDEYNYGLNKLWRDPVFLANLKKDLKEKCPSCKIKISGYASTDGKTKSNQTLSEDRAMNVANFLRDNILNDEDPEIKAKRFVKGEENGKGKGETGSNAVNERVDHLNKKLARYVIVSFEPDVTIDEINNTTSKKKVDDLKSKVLNNRIRSRFFNESQHFLKLKEEDPLAFNSMKEKIKFFHPSFHSITPEGFNSRLTFLHQCTRQGSTENPEGRPDNLSFGMAPVCILRLGDFYHTKIMIDSMNIEYENTWDINPEGVGVQPMIATVTLSFKFIGGHSMEGPINRLQNAVAFNFFANTEIYDPRADRIIIDSLGGGKYQSGIRKLEDLITGGDSNKPGVTTNLKEGVSNQEKDVEVLTTDTTPTQDDTTVAGGELKVNRIKKILLNDVDQGPDRIIGVGVLLDVSNLSNNLPNVTSYLDKKLKLTLMTPDGMSIIGEEFITNISTEGKSFIGACESKPFFLGVDNNSVYGYKKNKWTPGAYIVTLTYEGKKISTTLVSIKNR